MFPLRSILAAVDFSDASRVALGFAARLAAQCRSTLHVVHAQDPLLFPAARARRIDLIAEGLEELRTFVLATLPGGRGLALPHVVSGTAVQTICAVARRERADVVVMGVSGLSASNRYVVGTTTDGVLRRSDVSVLAVPATWKPPTDGAPDLRGLGPVFAGVDFTPSSRVAAATACQLAFTLGTSVEMVHCVPALPVLERWQPHAAASIEERTAAARKGLAMIVHRLQCATPVGMQVDAGTVADCLVDASRPATERSPVLVLGRRSRSQRGDSPGSTAYRVLVRTHVPVLVRLPDA